MGPKELTTVSFQTTNPVLQLEPSLKDATPLVLVTMNSKNEQCEAQMNLKSNLYEQKDRRRYQFVSLMSE